MIHDVKIALQFLTRLPIRTEKAHGMAELARAAWSFPLVGLGVGAVGALAYHLGVLAGLPLVLAAILAITATLAATGALHEDGLADTFDALGGHADRARALAIMRDSRIGTYGTLALVIGLMARTAALAAIAEPATAAAVLVAAGCLSRAAMAAAMALQAPARSDGLAAAAGRVAAPRATLAVVLAALLVTAVLPLPLAALLLMAAGATVLGMARWTRHRLGGFTGDTLGATQQVSEVCCLTICAGFWN